MRRRGPDSGPSPTPPLISKVHINPVQSIMEPPEVLASDDEGETRKEQVFSRSTLKPKSNLRNSGQYERKDKQKELIDFDIIKGSSLFNTKPSKHNQKLVRKAFIRIIFFPLYRKFWNTKCYLDYYLLTCCYVCHLICLGLFCVAGGTRVFSDTMMYEVMLPIILLVIMAICYSRASALMNNSDDMKRPEYIDPRLASNPKNHRRKAANMNGHMDTAILESDDSQDEQSASSSSEEDGPSSDDSEGEVSESEDLAHSHEDAEDEDEKTDGSDPKPKKKKKQPKPTKPTNPARRRFPSRRPYTSYNDQSFGDHFTRRQVNVSIWESHASIYPTKHSMSIGELRSLMLEKVKTSPVRKLYRKITHVGAVFAAAVPVLFRLFTYFQLQHENDEGGVVELFQLSPDVVFERLSRQYREQIVTQVLLIEGFTLLSSFVSMYNLAFILLSGLVDAEVTYYRRLLYAKCFTALTSSRRAREAGLPHFKLKNVVNIKAWLSLRGGRSWLKRQGRQRAADEIVSSSFLIVLIALVVMGIQAAAEQSGYVILHRLLQLELQIGCFFTSIFLLRYIMLGSRINTKYQSTSLLLTEQLNLYIRMMQAPHKRVRLMNSNNVLKVATKLLKELHSPNKISGLTMNPLLYNITRVLVLSAFSAALSDVFGFKLKLWKMQV